ncbi:MAG: zinc-binding dehydrogenase [Thermoprotei archaeon]|nr:MAG: zinc-binding dehydrogenase [Thermoprotei archaeon]
MLAARLYGARDLRLEDVPTPEVPEGWVLVRTLAVGICGTDKAFYLGTYPLFKVPLVPGHEVCGVVVGGPRDLVGRRVVPEINFSCGRCSLCRLGLYTHCPHKRTLGIDFDGGMAEYFVAPVSALHFVDDLDPVVATAVEPLAAVLNALEQYPPKPHMKVAVLGSGNLAILTIQVLKCFGVLDVAAIARDDSPKVKYLRELGVEVVTLSQLSDYVKRCTPEGLGFDMVFEVTGSPQGLELAIDITRPRGVIHLKSTPGARSCIDSTRAVVKELKIIGTRCGTFREFNKAIELIRGGIVRPIVTSTVKLRSVVEAFERSLRREEVKVVVIP